MPKGLYFTAVVSSFFFFLFWRLSLRSLKGSQPNLDNHLWLLFEKLVPNTPEHLPQGLGQKHFMKPTLNFDRTYLCNGTRCQSEKNLSITYRNSPTCPPIWWTLVQKRLITVGDFCLPAKVSHLETLPALPHGRYVTDSRPTLARVM